MRKTHEKNHYTYRITNIVLNKHYYGVRTSIIAPELDIGHRYFSSSSDKEFIKDQGDNPHNYKYKVIKIFNNRKSAIQLEIKLHNKFDVGVNESFYNKAKQTSTGRDTTGTTRDNSGERNGMFGKHQTDSAKKKISEMRKSVGATSTGQVSVHTGDCKYFRITSKEFKQNREKYFLAMVSHSEETKQKMRISASNRQRLKCPHCDKLNFPGMSKRWHFDNCKENPNRIEKDRSPWNKGTKRIILTLG